MTFDIASRHRRSRLIATLVGVTVIVAPTLGGLGLAALFDVPAGGAHRHHAALASAMPPAVPADMFDPVRQMKQIRLALHDARPAPR